MVSLIPKRFRGKKSQVKPNTSNTISVKTNKVNTNKQTILQRAIVTNQTLNPLIFPFPIKWNKQTEQYKINPNVLQFYWFLIIIKFAYVFLSTFLGYRILFNTSYHDGSNAGQIIFFNIAVLLGTSFIDSVFIYNSYDVVNSFNWSFGMEKKMLANFKIGKYNFSNQLGSFLLACVVCPSFLAFVGVSVGFVILDIYDLLVACFGTQYLKNKQMVKFITYILLIYESQIVSNTIRFMLLCLFHEAATRIILLVIMLRKRLSLKYVRIYQEISIVTRSLFLVEKLGTSAILGAAFFLILVGTCALVVFTKQNKPMLAIPGLMIALFMMVILQLIFIFGCLFYKFSTKLLRKWKLEIVVFDGVGTSRAYIRRVVKSLQIISLPARSVGIVDMDMKLNYLHNLLENVVNAVVLLNDVVF